MVHLDPEFVILSNKTLEVNIRVMFHKIYKPYNAAIYMYLYTVSVPGIKSLAVFFFGVKTKIQYNIKKIYISIIVSEKL